MAASLREVEERVWLVQVPNPKPTAAPAPLTPSWLLHSQIKGCHVPFNMPAVPPPLSGLSAAPSVMQTAVMSCVRGKMTRVRALGKRSVSAPAN